MCPLVTELPPGVKALLILGVVIVMVIFIGLLYDDKDRRARKHSLQSGYSGVERADPSACAALLHRDRGTAKHPSA